MSFDFSMITCPNGDVYIRSENVNQVLRHLIQIPDVPYTPAESTKGSSTSQ